MSLDFTREEEMTVSERWADRLNAVQREVNKIIQGKASVVERVLAALISGGHVLMEDIPGVGKTTLATTFARAVSLDYKRVQFTPDVLPSDILGFSMYDSNTGEFEFRPGSIFCNLFLADEINRTSPKTQSALLEVMEEKNATVEGVTRALPDPFMVIATENPIGSSGTQMLPESQLDRFMVCVSMGYPAHEDAINILKGDVAHKTDSVRAVLTADELIEIRHDVNNIFVHDSIYDYIVTLVEATRADGIFETGASPRGTIAMLSMGRAMAMLEGRDYVIPEDIQSVVRDVLGHRVKISARAKAQGMDMDKALDSLVRSVSVPRINHMS